eukprot:CAMPEP_0113939620 /NCGR_PEP_ID=MMETSP1339-20121228/5909_1 /TAXON_ID=94617 /ORGANISM="Fibrocapsa japonica" /LENGTH=385 /DNA_ID=CAMNT_0000943189 /DNA_START=95 /DNA_END=1249 /DNA_ORIENTATION=- /assembly_acc=CAM_ASM_000762
MVLVVSHPELAFSPKLELQAAERRDPGLDPLLLVHLPDVVHDVPAVRRHLDPHDEVRRVAGGRQRAPPGQDLVHGAAVDPALGVLPELRRVQVDDRHGRVQLLGDGVVQAVGLRVPAGALQEQAADVDAVLGLLVDVLPVVHVQHVEVEVDRVDRERVLAREVLLGAGQERLREVEPRDPEHVRDAVLDPLPDELQALNQVVHPAGQRLHRGVGLVLPRGRHLVNGDGLAHVLQLCAHHHQALQRLVELGQGPQHLLDQAVVPDALLHKHSVHGLLVDHRVLHPNGLDVERPFFRQLLVDVCRHVAHSVLLAAPATGGVPRLQGKDGVEHGEGLRERAGDVGVLVQAKHLGPGRQRQAVNVLDVARLRVRLVEPHREVHPLRVEL